VTSRSAPPTVRRTETRTKRTTGDAARRDEQPTTAERSRDFNHSLSRGLEIIESFGADAMRQTVSEVASKTGLTRATARRFLITLVELGYMLDATSCTSPGSLGPG
jgi:IclR family pca regulon transcriptional regulator